MAGVRLGVRTALVAACLVLQSAAMADVPAGGPAPEISGESWINSPPLSLAALRGKVALVEFWTFACWNCQHVEPQLKRWHERYAEKGLVIVGVQRVVSG